MSNNFFQGIKTFKHNCRCSVAEDDWFRVMGIHYEWLLWGVFHSAGCCRGRVLVFSLDEKQHGVYMALKVEFGMVLKNSHNVWFSLGGWMSLGFMPGCPVEVAVVGLKPISIKWEIVLVGFKHCVLFSWLLEGLRH